jgi:hypothetical protein
MWLFTRGYFVSKVVQDFATIHSAGETQVNHTHMRTMVLVYKNLHNWVMLFG